MIYSYHIRMFILLVTGFTCTSYIHIDSHICIGLFYDIFLSHENVHSCCDKTHYFFLHTYWFTHIYWFILWYILIISERSFLKWLDLLVLLMYINSHICIGADLILWYILIISDRTFLLWLDLLFLHTYILIHTYVLVYFMIYSYHIECSFL